MRRKDIVTNERTAFGRGIAKGFNATQKGGALAPDSAQQAIKKFFTEPGKDPKDKDKDKEKTKNTVVTKNPADANKPTEKGKSAPTGKTDNKKLNPKEPVPDGAQFIDGKIEWKYDNNKNLWVSSDNKTLLSIMGIKAYNNAPEDKRQYNIKEETMGKAIREGLADLAGRAEADHEVQMARADLYKIAKYAIKLHDMLKDVSEERGMEGWQQAKITKAADYIGSVYHNLDYDLKFGDQNDEIGPDKEMQMGEGVEMCPDACCGKPVTECKCGPDCEHCDCHEQNKMREAKPVDAYKQAIAEKLKKKLKASVTPPSAPADIKADNIKPSNIKAKQSMGGGGGK